VRTNITDDDDLDGEIEAFMQGRFDHTVPVNLWNSNVFMNAKEFVETWLNPVGKDEGVESNG
jgi:hypothetical protein